jgi:hypothetical protein
MSHRESAARHERQKNARAAEIGPPPPIVNRNRRDACERDLHKFLVEYFPHSTGMRPFCDDQIAAIKRLELCGLQGGLFLSVLPRGFAKSSMGEGAVLWATLYGHRRFVPFFAADASKGAQSIESIKLELSENDLLFDDFPEVCHPVRALEGRAQRCASQTCEGQLTHIGWTADEIVLPQIKDSRASGAVISAHGLTAASRGMKHKMPDGTQQRPDFIVIDDPQTDASAVSPVQVRQRLDLIRKNILRLGSHGKKIAVVINGTVIAPDDLIAQLLDQKRAGGAWQSLRVKMVRKWAGAHETLWMEDYARLRRSFDPQTLGDQQRAWQAATDLYLANRAKMDAGCDVAWEHCYDHDIEVSAIQHAYNFLIDDGPDVFASEAQNEPVLADRQGLTTTLTAREIAAKVNGLPRAIAPQRATRIVAFIDPKETILIWTVMAFEESFDGYVIDYGTWPDQHRRYFAMNAAKKTLQSETGLAAMEPAVYAGLDALANRLCKAEWKREGGENLKVELCLIDAHYGKLTKTVETFCRQSPHSAVLRPSHGMYFGVGGRSMNEMRVQPGDRLGMNWRIPHDKRHVLFDTNFYKSFVHARWATPFLARGCLSLFGRKRDDNKPDDEHEMFADHQVAEEGIEKSAKGRTVVEWQIKSRRPDNDFLDDVVGCHVAASILGCSLIPEIASRTRRVKLSELQKHRKVWGPGPRE